MRTGHGRVPTMPYAVEHDDVVRFAIEKQTSEQSYELSRDAVRVTPSSAILLPRSRPTEISVFD